MLTAYIYTDSIVYEHAIVNAEVVLTTLPEPFTIGKGERLNVNYRSTHALYTER